MGKQLPSRQNSGPARLLILPDALALLGLFFLALGCAGPICHSRDRGWEQACTECTHQAVLDSQEEDPHVGSQITLKERTDRCLRERGLSPKPLDDSPG